MTQRLGKNYDRLRMGVPLESRPAFGKSRVETSADGWFEKAQRTGCAALWVVQNWGALVVYFENPPPPLSLSQNWGTPPEAGWFLFWFPLESANQPHPKTGLNNDAAIQ